MGALWGDATNNFSIDITAGTQPTLAGDGSLAIPAVASGGKFACSDQRLVMSGNFSVEARLKTSVKDTYIDVVGQDKTSGSWPTNRNFILGASNTNRALFQVCGNSSSAYYTCKGTSIVTDGEYHTIKGVVSGSNLEIWVDGVKENTIIFSARNTLAVNTQFGYNTNGTSYAENLDYVKLWDGDGNLVAWFSHDRA